LRLERSQICFRENPKRTLDFLAPQIGVGLIVIGSLPEAEIEPNLSIGMGRQRYIPFQKGCWFVLSINTTIKINNRAYLLCQWRIAYLASCHM
jgi:hypothetical protein